MTRIATPAISVSSAALLLKLRIGVASRTASWTAFGIRLGSCLRRAHWSVFDPSRQNHVTNGGNRRVQAWINIVADDEWR